MSEIKQALKPFSTFAEHAVENVDGTWVWKNNQNERICDWFGPTDFGATLSSAAVAEREPVAWLPTATVKWLEDYDGPACGTKTVAHNRPIKTDGGIPVYLDPPPTSELEAENAKLWDRVAEAMKALGEAYRIIGKLEAYAINDIMYDGRDVAAWCADYAARRVREGGKVDG